MHKREEEHKQICRIVILWMELIMELIIEQLSQIGQDQIKKVKLKREKKIKTENYLYH